MKAFALSIVWIIGSYYNNKILRIGKKEDEVGMIYIYRVREGLIGGRYDWIGLIDR